MAGLFAKFSKLFSQAPKTVFAVSAVVVLGISWLLPKSKVSITPRRPLKWLGEELPPEYKLQNPLEAEPSYHLDTAQKAVPLDGIFFLLTAQFLIFSKDLNTSTKINQSFEFCLSMVEGSEELFQQNFSTKLNNKLENQFMNCFISLLVHPLEASLPLASLQKTQSLLKNYSNSMQIHRKEQESFMLLSSEKFFPVLQFKRNTKLLLLKEF